MHRLSSLAILLFLSSAYAADTSTQNPAKPLKAAPKKSQTLTAAKRSKALPPPTVSSHSRSKPPVTAESRSASAAAAKVVVTRKKVNGRWVKNTRVVHAQPGPTYQLRPDTERYQQIQQALAAKGFFKGEANGEWGEDSVDALKRYQASANLQNDGKIGSLTLIGLGLGPKHDGSITPPPAPAAPAVKPPAAQP